MDFSNIIFETEKEVATITLNRPEVSNGFNIPICQEILEALTIVEKDETLKILIINANGKVFSVGGDLAEMQRAVEAERLSGYDHAARMDVPVQL